MLPSFDRALPKTRTVTAAMAIPGTAMMTSRMRMIVSDRLLRTTAATEPMIAPKNRATSVDRRPIISE